MPRMLLLESQHLSRLSITQRRFILAQLPRNRRIRTCLLQIFHRGHLQRGGRVRGIEYLKAHSIFLNAEITYLAQVSCIDVTPCIPFPCLWLVYVFWEVLFVLVGLDYVANSQGVDVCSRESPCETSGAALAA